MKKLDVIKSTMCFNHLLNKHQLLSEKGNKKIIEYFQAKIGKCHDNNKCQYLLIHIRDIEKNNKSLKNNNISCFDDMMASIHSYTTSI